MRIWRARLPFTGYKRTARRSSARLWSGVGVVSMSKDGAPPVGWTVFLEIVARSASRVRKLWTGAPSSVVFVAALLSARSESPGVRSS
jgi:hypothetical protein